MIKTRLAILAGMFAATCSGSILTLVPGANISGAPGTTIGWGYTITNSSTTSWLQPLGLSAGSFAGLLPTSIFDYPAIAPGTTVTELFSTATLTANCTSLPCGLYEVTIPGGTSPVTVTGIFTLTADFYNGDPNNGGADTGAAPNLTASYSATVTAVTNNTPEPASAALMMAGLGAVGIFISKARKSVR